MERSSSLKVERLIAREALDELAEGLRISKGNLRIEAHFHDGKLDRPVRVTIFRIPPAAAHTIRLTERFQASGRRAQLLEHLAHELAIYTGDTTLTAEYTQDAAGLRLHWIDVSWDD